MAPKSFLVTGLVVMLVVAAPAAEAQLQGIFSSTLGSTLGLIQIQGIVPCSQTISSAINGTLTPVFPNAQVQLTCGVGNIIAMATTNAAGIFSMLLNPLHFLFSELSNCRLVVPTPLSNCNPALTAEGVLQSPLQFIATIILGLLNIINITPAAFQFVPV